MKPAPKHYIFRYDPGGDDRHGVALLEVVKNKKAWRAQRLHLSQKKTAADVISEVENIVGKEEIVATGIDTLTAWSNGSAGWRPADSLLRKKYPEVILSVDNPNHINGSMRLNGAIVLRWLRERKDRGGNVTEVHPKVCFFVLKNRVSRHPWARIRRNDNRPAPADREEAKRWLLDLLHPAEPFQIVDFGNTDHRFDALMGCLAAFHGINRTWNVELHHPVTQNVIHPFGLTHFWWPEDVTISPTCAH